MTRALEVPVAAVRCGESVATWGQQAMWWRMHHTDMRPADFTLGVGAVCAPGHTIVGVAAVLAELVARHDSLRTRFLVHERGPRQALPDRDVLSVEVHEVERGDLRAAGEAVVHRIAADPFDLGVDLPVRAAVLTTSGVPVAALLALSHMAVDGFGLGVLEDELAAALAGVDPTGWPAAVQPADLARHESAPHGVAAGARSLKYWRQQLMTSPPPLRGASADGRLVCGRLDSPGVGIAARELARSAGATSAAVYAAATATVLGRRAGIRRCGIMLMSNNRFAKHLRRTVTTMTQPVLATVDLHCDFPTTVRAAWLASIRAHRHARYDPTRLAEVEREVEADRGAPLRLDCFVNDTRRRAPSVPPDSTRATRADSRFSWETERPPERAAFFLNIGGEQHGRPTALMLSADTTVLQEPEVESILYSIEELLMSAALDAASA